MTHESQMHPTNCTLTLTYDDKNLPQNGSLVPDDHADFIRSLRKRTGRKVRYFHCGEYGGSSLRPHYHTVLFGYDFPDKVYAKNSPSGHPLYRSPSLEKTWTKGIALIGSLTFESAQYAAKYATKVINVSKRTDEASYKRWLQKYERVDPATGEIHQVEPEYCSMSRKPGLGREWLKKYWRDIYPADYVVMKGQKMPVPRYYDKVLEQMDPQLLEEVKERRAMERDKTNDAEERLRAMEQCALARNNLHGERN